MDKVNINQLFDKETSTFTYIIADPQTGDAWIIYSVVGQVERDLKFLSDNKLKLKLIFETHVHADHVTSAGFLKNCTGAKIGVSEFANTIGQDLTLKDGVEIAFGGRLITCIATPGHTNSCMSYYFEGNLFTGDALLINSCGRTDFQGGSSEKLFHSVRENLFSLPDDTVLYPAHDYKGCFHQLLASRRKLILSLDCLFQKKNLYRSWRV